MRSDISLAHVEVDAHAHFAVIRIQFGMASRSPSPQFSSFDAARMHLHSLAGKVVVRQQYEAV